MDNDEKINLFDSGVIELKKVIVPEDSTFEWKEDGKLILTLRKDNAPSFWKYLLKDPVKEVKELQVWWEIRDKYIEVLEDMMMEENIKERAEQNDLWDSV